MSEDSRTSHTAPSETPTNEVISEVTDFTRDIIMAATERVKIDHAGLEQCLSDVSLRHRQLVESVVELSEVVAKEVVSDVENLALTAQKLDSIFKKIDLLEEHVLNIISVVTPIYAAVKDIHDPRDIRGKAVNLLKSIGFSKGSKVLEGNRNSADAMWSRIPPFILMRRSEDSNNNQRLVSGNTHWDPERHTWMTGKHKPMATAEDLFANGEPPKIYLKRVDAVFNDYRRQKEKYLSEAAASEVVSSGVLVTQHCKEDPIG
eukprot:Tbor_TRINITY_DN1993_c0_g1::TRINITY_DN1993_c0_g1_i1::g.3470::m.3470